MSVCNMSGNSSEIISLYLKTKLTFNLGLSVTCFLLLSNSLVKQKILCCFPINTWSHPEQCNLEISTNILLYIFTRIKPIWTSLVVQGLRLRAPTAGGTSLIPGQGTKIPSALRHGQKNKTKKQRTPIIKLWWNRELLLRTMCMNLTILREKKEYKAVCTCHDSISLFFMIFIYLFMVSAFILKSKTCQQGKVDGCTLPSFKTYYKATVIKAVIMAGQTFRPME